MTHHSREVEATMLYTFARTLAKGNSAVEHNRVVEKFDLYCLVKRYEVGDKLIVPAPDPREVKSLNTGHARPRNNVAVKSPYVHVCLVKINLNRRQ